MTLLLDVALRGSIVLLVGLLLCVALRKRAPALRHALLAATLCVTPIIAPLGALLPAWKSACHAPRSRRRRPHGSRRVLARPLHGRGALRDQRHVGRRHRRSWLLLPCGRFDGPRLHSVSGRSAPCPSSRVCSCRSYDWHAPRGEPGRLTMTDGTQRWPPPCEPPACVAPSAARKSPPRPPRDMGLASALPAAALRGARLVAHAHRRRARPRARARAPERLGLADLRHRNPRCSGGIPSPGWRATGSPSRASARATTPCWRKGSPRMPTRGTWSPSPAPFAYPDTQPSPCRWLALLPSTGESRPC